jgi:type I restriction enzyme S subunit
MSFARYPAYKDSGVEWLGEVPGHWEVKRLKYNLQLLTEKTNRRDHAIALENIESWTGRYLPTETEFEGDGVAFEAGDILFGKLRPYLAKAYLTESSGEAVGDFHVLRPTPNTNARFAQYQILNREFIDLVDGSTFGSKMPRASWEFVASITLASPPKAEQRAIAKFLDVETVKIDGLMAEQRALVALLKEKRQAVISHAVTKGLNPAAPLKDSGVAWLGEVPGHWEVKALKHIVSMRSGEQITSDDIEESGDYKVFGGNGERGYTSNFTHDGEFALIGRQGALCGNINYAAGKFWASEHAVVVTPRQPCNVRWLGELLRTMNLGQYSVTAAQPGLSVEAIGNLQLPVPTFEEQQAISAYLLKEATQLDTLTQEAQTAVALLQERRTALISAAVTGKMDVRGAVAA